VKVKDLLEELKRADPAADVRAEGCDCYGDVASVKWHAGDDIVYLKRPRHGGGSVDAALSGDDGR
jgi:hypothetical protein